MPTASPPNLTVADLFTGYSLSRFIDQVLYRLPFSLPDTAAPFCIWGNWDTLSDLLQNANADVMLARSNEQYAGPAPADSATARALSVEGYTILVRHAERHHKGIAELAADFAKTFGGAVDAHIYATPANHFGFSWHYDAEDVFILQLAGEKEYQLRKNTVNPWPLEETLPVDMRYERELMPLMRVKLEAGDLLYIPCGYWHRAIAGRTDEMAISLAIGVMSPSAMNLFDLLRPQLLDSLLWRQRLPRDADDDVVSELLRMLASDLARTITSPSFREILGDRGMLRRSDYQEAP